MSLRGIRGATTVESNTPDEILKETRILLQEVMTVNQISAEDIASILFSVTRDLNSEFPAKAAREMGLVNTPLLCFNEIDVPGSLGKCIRILLHVNSTVPQAEIKHIYLKEAKSLRPDQTKV